MISTVALLLYAMFLYVVAHYAGAVNDTLSYESISRGFLRAFFTESMRVYAAVMLELSL